MATKTFEEQIQELAEPVQKVIKEAFEKKMAEAREKIYVQARKEITEKYKADFDSLVNGAELFIAESIKEVCEDLNQAKAEKKAYQAKCNEAMKKMQSMIAESLAKEVAGIRQEKKAIAEKMESFEKLVTESLKGSVKELQEEKNRYIASNARIIEEGLKMQESAKSNFVKVASAKAADMIFENMGEEIKALKKEIKEAQKNEFGRRIFEMFSGEFKALFLNENKEVQKIESEKAKLNVELNKANRLVESKNLQVKALKEEIEVQKELRKRDMIIAEASKGLSANKQEVLKRMVESVATERLEATINDYIPVVMSQKPTKKFTESKVEKVTAPKLAVKTGDKAVVVNESVKPAKPASDVNKAIENIELDVDYINGLLEA